MNAPEKTNPRVLIAAGGSGGHVFPALFIAQAMKKLYPESTVEFIGAGRPVEAKILSPSGFPYTVIRSAGVKNRGLRGIFEFLVSIPVATFQLFQIFRRFQPDVVIGVGGFVSVLPVLAGRLCGRKTWIHEAEVHPGLANRALSAFVHRISVAFAESTIGPKRKVVVTGQPVRESLEIFRTAPQEFLKERPHNVLIMGGSQGARSLDLAAESLAPFLAAHGLAVWHQTRPDSVAEVQRHYQSAGVAATVCSFIEKMEEAYGWADIIISRSGAGSISEIALVNKPAVFVPLPLPGRDDAEINARILADRGKALVVLEGDQFTDRLKAAVKALSERTAYLEMIRRPVILQSTCAAEMIATGTVSLLK